MQGDPARDLPSCVACHGPQLLGVAPAMPGLLGLPADYINGQLGDWRNGARHAAEPDCMAHIAKQLTLDEVGAVSRWLAAQPVPAGAKPLPAVSALPAPWPVACGSTGAAQVQR